MRCDTGYSLIGASRVVCNDSSSPLPLCRARLCSPPFVPHAHTIQQQRGSYTHGQSVHWACQSGYWVSIGVTEVSSTCNEGSISPPLAQVVPPALLQLRDLLLESRLLSDGLWLWLWDRLVFRVLPTFLIVLFGYASNALQASLGAKRPSLVRCGMDRPAVAIWC